MRTHVEFHVADVDASIAFYAAFGFTVVRRWKDWALLDLDGARLTIQGDAYARSHPHYFTDHLDGPRGIGVEVAVEVADLDAAFETATRLGAVVKGLQDRSWGARDFRIGDPDGYFVRFTTPLTGE